jgi:hypothetical protein
MEDTTSYQPAAWESLDFLIFPFDSCILFQPVFPLLMFFSGEDVCFLFRCIICELIARAAAADRAIFTRLMWTLLHGERPSGLRLGSLALHSSVWAGFVLYLVSQEKVAIQLKPAKGNPSLVVD